MGGEPQPHVENSLYLNSEGVNTKFFRDLNIWFYFKVGTQENHTFGTAAHNLHSRTTTRLSCLLTTLRKVHFKNKIKIV